MNRNVLVLLVVRVIANFADSFYFLASVWYVKETTDASAWIGVTTFAAMIPVAFQVLYGPLVDCYSKKNLLLVSMAIQAM
ncbi:MAG: MFS transporter, partial [Exiguobacterium sp.]|nr:MFS transporter [Exiguobacterium sp.]